MALSSAEKQRRYRERRKRGLPPVRYVETREKKFSRPQLWHRHVAGLREIQEHFVDVFERLSEPLLDTPYGERVQAMVELDLDCLEDVDFPLGFGRD